MNALWTENVPCASVLYILQIYIKKKKPEHLIIEKIVVIYERFPYQGYSNSDRPNTTVNYIKMNQQKLLLFFFTVLIWC